MNHSSSSIESNSSVLVPAYDQWQQWAQKRKQSRRQEDENLLYGGNSSISSSICSDDVKVQQFMELPRKQASKAGSLLDDSDDDEDDNNSSSETDQQQSPWKMMQQRMMQQQQSTKPRSSLLDDDDDDDDEQENLEREMPHRSLGADALFLPPTSLKRSAPIAPLPVAFASSFNNGHSSRSLLLNNKSLNKSINFDTSAVARSPSASLSMVTAMSSRRRFTLARDGSMPVV